MNTRQYYYLITVADSSNLSQAASALGLTPSALSKFLTSLESLMGGTLFIRTPALSLTPLGQKALAAARNILDEQNRMLLTIRSLTGGIQKKIRLATSPNRGAIIYSRIYQPFSRRYPDTALELTELYSQEQTKAIRRSQIDLALGNGEFSTQVTDLPFARGRSACCASAFSSALPGTRRTPHRAARYSLCPPKRRKQPAASR